jgi:hypothetical protein
VDRCPTAETDDDAPSGRQGLNSLSLDSPVAIAALWENFTQLSFIKYIFVSPIGRCMGFVGVDA